MSSQFSDYSAIDPVLDRWADKNNLFWIRDDRGWTVRTLFWPLVSPDSMQLWVDEPANGHAVVHVCHNTTAGGQQHTTIDATFTNLESALDDSLVKARSLADELKRTAGA